MKYNYGETFELMQAYSNLGCREHKIIEHLMTMEMYEGTYSNLEKKLNIACSNLRKSLIYLDSIGIIHIVKKDNSLAMKACFLIDNWLDVLIDRYRKNHIQMSRQKQKEIVDYYNKIEEEEKERERQYEEITYKKQIVKAISSYFNINEDISSCEVEKMLEKFEIKIKE